MLRLVNEIGEVLVRLASADNFRDVSGPGYRATDGTALRTGVLFRSNELQLDDADIASMGQLALSAIYDLRGDEEVEASPDVTIPGVAWHHVPVHGIVMDSVATLADRDAAVAVMCLAYRGFVEDPDGRAAFGELLGRIADTEGAQVFHCTAGKDRTGWAAALLLHVAGVDDDVVLTDYLRTNKVSGTREKYRAIIGEHLGEDKVEVYEALMVADARYLQAGYDAVTTTYGDRATYLREGLGLDAATLTRLRAVLRD